MSFLQNIYVRMWHKVVKTKSKQFELVYFCSLTVPSPSYLLWKVKRVEAGRLILSSFLLS